MRPSAVAVDFGVADSETPRTSSEFEEIPYPPNHWAASRQEEELPLHYMSEEKARRRTGRGGHEGAGIYDTPGTKEQHQDEYNDEGKDVYNKIRPVKNRVGSGRMPPPPAPPATTIVRKRSRSTSPRFH